MTWQLMKDPAGQGAWAPPEWAGRLPGWVLPVVGGTLVVVVIVLWYTAALYYFNGFQLPHL